ncbi:hypothetical protein SAMN03159341_102308 [Paenibacillus sp. 1_12]|uniref:hypothetical protein n=1 Tax=Paenibacillus sp. 1_12 TaxID=1566278 RepID=UPI0008E826DC|nr:hypothetical protein [Paenibacillus sp. 1_12]SFK94598.1 hypothetical protein SAMN03159341_102308 [Paenibacillus sp. 1_12]
MSKKNMDQDTHPISDFIITPEDQQDAAPTDMVSEAVEEIMDKVETTFDGKPDNERGKSNK